MKMPSNTKIKNKDYVHGYTSRESERLLDQASTLTDLLHSDTSYPQGSRVLEAGCGIGAQTITLAKNSPGAHIVSIDISEESLTTAEHRIRAAGIRNVEFKHADIYELPFNGKSFDHVFVCFVLEHIPDPSGALKLLKDILKSGGSITVIEGDHGSAYFYPYSEAAKKTIQCLIDLQAQAGGNSLIGRELYPILVDAGFRRVLVSPRMVYVDASRPELVEGFTKNTFTAMVEGVREHALDKEMIDEKTWEKGIADLYRTTETDGTFCYTFFKAVGLKP
jgi:ubiquinone/menaquinone biosynthesis C-methylase UbiE